MRAKIVLGALCVAIAGCATPYQEMGFLGGVTAVRISEDTAQIKASGNAYTDPDAIQRYALRRAAEETLSDGFDRFRIVDTTDRTRTGTASTGYATGGRGWASGFGYSSAVIHPGESMMIKMLKGPVAGPLPDGEYDAHDVVKYLTTAIANSDHRDCVTAASGKVVCK